jgi:GrpB-like predicted nucleotidyltransferase (UPF0157 family)
MTQSNLLTDRLKKFTENNIGLVRGQVLLQPFNHKWKRLFSDEAYILFDELRDESLRLYHCGSTSVEGLDAKPIIDIVGSVYSLEDLDKNKMKLESIGYEYKGEYGIKGRRYCVLYNSEKTTGYVHLHIFQHNDLEVEKHLSFRDHLRSSVKDREAYLNHKKYLINEIQINRSDYSEGKNEIISKIQINASAVKQSRKVLAILGASVGHKNTLNFLKDEYKEDNLEIIDLNQMKVDAFIYSDLRDDNFVEIIKKALDVELIVLATPVYWYSMSGVMKDFMDRFSDLLGGKHKHFGELLYGKKLELLSTGYDLKLPLGFEVPFAGTAIYFGIDYVGAKYRSCR